ncbi:MAG: acyl-CoA dehydrogenase family protein [Pseudomonadota bacterium]
MAPRVFGMVMAPVQQSSVPPKHAPSNAPSRYTSAIDWAIDLHSQLVVQLSDDRARQHDLSVAEWLSVNQLAAHGLAWLSTTLSALQALNGWARTLEDGGSFAEADRLGRDIVFGEYCRQIAGGIPMGQGEIFRLQGHGIDPFSSLSADLAEAIEAWARPALKVRLGELVAAHTSSGGPASALLSNGLEDETLVLARDQTRRLVASDVAPFAQDWHRADALIPLSVVQSLADLGVFGMTLPEDFGGMGLGKMAMCAMAEELSRGMLAVGSLATRSEIAGDLIAQAGTLAQKGRFLPGLADGSILPTAVFTEPAVGSDLGSLTTRAELTTNRDGQAVYRVTGNKTWITHGARSDLMTLLVRTDPKSTDHRGLSMLLAEKPRGTETEPFPAVGMSGGEIPVLGYRGMKEYEIRFDGFEVPAENLLGGEEGQGFRQLMATFESARIQTAARAIGVAQNALDLGASYAVERQQFGKSLSAFPRIASKLGIMAAETLAAQQLTYFAAREKDDGRRADRGAGMAKLLAARVAWMVADQAVQIHGGNGYAEEYPISRVLVDARILNIFEGAAEIQATVVARGLLAARN